MFAENVMLSLLEIKKGNIKCPYCPCVRLLMTLTYGSPLVAVRACQAVPHASSSADCGSSDIPRSSTGGGSRQLISRCVRGVEKNYTAKHIRVSGGPEQ